MFAHAFESARSPDSKPFRRARLLAYGFLPGYEMGAVSNGDHVLPRLHPAQGHAFGSLRPESSAKSLSLLFIGVFCKLW